MPSFIHAPPPQEEIIISDTKVTHTTPDHHTQVTWRENGQLTRSVRLQSPVKQAITSSFEGNLGRCLCVLLSDQITLFSRGGTIHTIPLPFPLHRMWSLPSGLLVERDASDADPIWFSIFHPLDGLCPISFFHGNWPTMPPPSQASPAAPAAEESPTILSGSHSVLLVHHDPPLLLSYSSASRKHTLWLLRRHKERDAPRVGFLVPEADHSYQSKGSPVYRLAASTPRSMLARTLGIPRTPTTPEETPGKLPDQIVQPSDSVVCLDPLWEQAGHDTRCSRSFVAHAANHLLVCLLNSEEHRLYVLPLHRAGSLPQPLRRVSVGLVGQSALNTPWLPGQSFSIEADDALPLVATRPYPLCDILVRKGDHFALHVDRFLICPAIQLPRGTDSSPLVHRSSSAFSIGSQEFCAPFRPRSPLVRDCLDTVAAVLSEADYAAFYQSFLLTTAPLEDDDDPDWSVLSQLLAPYQHTRHSTDWERVLSSAHHSRTMHTSMHLSPPSQPSKHAPALIVALNELHDAMLLSVLSRRSNAPRLAHVLWRMCVSIGWVNHADSYARWHGFQLPSVLPQPSPSEPPVCTMSSWILGASRPPKATTACLATATGRRLHDLRHVFSLLYNWPRDPLPLLAVVPSTPGATPSPSILAGKHRPFIPQSQSKDVGGYAFTPIHSSEDRSIKSSSAIRPPVFFTPGRTTPSTPLDRVRAVSNAHHVVLALVESGIDAHVLDQLSPGVSLPLRQALAACRANPPTGWPSNAYKLVGRDDLAMAVDGQRKQNSQHSAMTSALSDLSGGTKAKPSDSVQGIELPSDGVSALRFREDRRLAEVQRMLCSAESLHIRVEARPEMSDHDLMAAQQAHLLAMAGRTMSLPVGRGMLTLGTLIPGQTEALPIPPLVLSGRVPPHGARISLDVSEQPLTMTHWPDFHNGVASGLRVSTSASVSGTWIAYQRPDEGLAPSHAGLLLGLGLQGHLPQLATVTVFHYLQQGHDLTNVALLLGMASSKRGSMDTMVTKMLSIHVPALLPPGSADLEIPPAVQSAALVSLGLLYQGTANRRMTEVCLGEIGRSSYGESSSDDLCEAHSVAAGLALGMVASRSAGGSGRSVSTGLSDLRLGEALRRLLVGSHTASRNTSDHTIPGRSHRVKEGDSVALDMTVPGATIALGLVFMQSGDEAISNCLQPPEGLSALTAIRPDLLLLRSAARALVCWNSIRPSSEWIESCVPSSCVEVLTNKRAQPAGIRASIQRAVVCIMAGGALGMALRYAGTQDAQAHDALLKVLGWLEEAAKGRKGGDSALVQPIPSSSIDSCLVVVAQAVSIVVAGSGHLPTTRVLRRLCRMPSTRLNYGLHMGLNMAMGLLYLGGGTPACVAALLGSMYPLLPQSSNDDRYHLQALRHLYVLAAEPRLLILRHVDNGQLCYAPVELELDGVSRSAVAPLLVPGTSKQSFRVSVRSEQLWPVSMQERTEWPCTVWVRRKVGQGHEANAVPILDDAFLASDSLAKEQPDLFPTYVALWDAIRFGTCPRGGAFDVMDAVFILSGRSSLVPRSFLAAVRARLDAVFNEAKVTENPAALVHYIKTGVFPSWSTAAYAGCFLLYWEIPFRQSLWSLGHELADNTPDAWKSVSTLIPHVALSLGMTGFHRPAVTFRMIASALHSIGVKGFA